MVRTEAFAIRDLGSLNGTWINGERISEERKVTRADIDDGTWQPGSLQESGQRVLEAGMLINVGRYDFKVFAVCCNL